MKRGRGSCPYLDTVDRSVLDFDYEKVCSVTLSTSSVYACLVCGAFFRGRAVGTPAHTHSLAADHHVFLCLATQRAYCLPDDYEIGGHALDDMRRVLDPRYSAADVAALDEFRAFFADKDVAAAEAQIEQAYDDVRAAARWRLQSQKDDIGAWLAAHC